MTSEKNTTRQKIIAAAKNLFSIHGYGQTSIEDIITAAGVTKGAFYHYFKSKETICEEIINSMQAEYQNIFESLPKETNPLEKLRFLVGRLVELNNSGQWVNCKLMLRLSSHAHFMQMPIKQKLDNFWKWYADQYLILIEQCRNLNLIGDKLSAQQQTDFLVNTLIANTWKKTAFDNGFDKEILDYIIEKL